MALGGARPGTDRPAFIVNESGEYRVRHWFTVDIVFLAALLLICIGIVVSAVALIDQAR
jgi:hypothetical protein